MIYAYRLKDKTGEAGKTFDGITVREAWQFTSDAKVAVLKKWEKVAVLEAENIQAAKKAAAEYDESAKPSSEEKDDEYSLPDALQGLNDPLANELAPKTLSEIKAFAKANGFDEAEYSKLAKSKLIEYVVLGMATRENA